MKGLVRKDGATLKDAAPDGKAGRIKLEFLGSYPDTLDAHENSSSNLDAQKMSETEIKDGEYTAASYSVATSRMYMAPDNGSATCTVLNTVGKKDVCNLFNCSIQVTNSTS